MYIDDFIWLPDIVEKLENKHRVFPEEAEDVFFNQPHFRFVERGHVAGEDVYVAMGQTDSGLFHSQAGEHSSDYQRPRYECSRTAVI